jgi:uncharacterized protein YcaQ
VTREGDPAVRQTTRRPLTLSQGDARRLAISRQHLAGPRPPADAATVRAALRSLRYLQLDPVTVVAPSHDLVLWSRLGPRAGPHLADLLWRERSLFEYWAHAAAIVLTEDYPIHRVSMNLFPPITAPEGRRIAVWMDANEELRRHILHRLVAAGPLPTSGFEDRAVVGWQSSGWTAGRNVERMLEFLWLQGEVMVAGRAAGRKLWGLPDACLPPDADRAAAPLPEMVAMATEHSLRALGIAREADVKQYFIRNRYRGLRQVLRTLEDQGRVVPARVDGGGSPAERWFVHVDALGDLERVQVGDWRPRTALLSPFDNLIIDRGRTERLWGFAFRNEMYVPKANRRHGYYLLPILHGDALVGRVSPRLDRRRGTLLVEGLYLEPDVRPTAHLCRAVVGQLTDLAAFVGATAIEYGDAVPDRWRAMLHRS